MNVIAVCDLGQPYCYFEREVALTTDFVFIKAKGYY